MRITKAGLLKNTTEFSKKLGTYGAPISWEDINMYQITDEVIKKVIPYKDPDGEWDPKDPKRRWYSWMELVSARPQPAAVMFSHWWGGRFQDFMAVVDRLELDRSFSNQIAIWICTFANSQFGEDFGAMLEECPFIKTLRTVSLTVLVVDFKGGSLERTWCGLEVHYTVNNEMEFVLYTSAGQVGSRYVSGGPLVEAMMEWDIRKSEASDPPYRRQILNYVAGVDELEGLKKNADGGMEVDSMGRPQLQGGPDEPLDSDAERRLTGEEEFAYEATLFRKHGKRFEDLNMMVRMSVMKNLHVSRKGKGCVGKVPDCTLRGLTLNQLRVVCKKLQATCPWTEETCPWCSQKDFGDVHQLLYEDLTNRMVKRWVKHMTASAACSYMELIAPGPQVPQYLMEHASAQRWAECMMAIERFAEAERLPDSAVFWVDIFSVNVHRQEGDLVRRVDGSVVNEVHGLIRVLPNDRELLQRGWEWYTVDLAVQAGKSIYFACKSGIMACNRPFKDGSWVSGCFDAGTASMIANVDLHNITTTYEMESAKILEIVRRKADCAPGSIEDGIERFQARLRYWCSGPMLRGAAEANDAEAIFEMCKWHALRLNSDHLKGPQGETPLHIAAALNSGDALEELLRGGMDPNIEDDMSERPLHYAVLAGHASMARTLIEAQADPWAENSYAETPLQVAQQNPAAFLGVDMTEMLELLTPERPGGMSHSPKAKERSSAVGDRKSVV